MRTPFVRSITIKHELCNDAQQAGALSCGSPFIIICTLSLRLATAISARGAFSTACGGTLCQKKRVSPPFRTISALQEMCSRSSSPPPSEAALNFASSLIAGADEDSQLPLKRDRSPASASAAGFALPPLGLRIVAETLLPDDSSAPAPIQIQPALFPAGGNNCPPPPYVVEETQAAGGSRHASDSSSEEENEANAATRAIPQDWSAGDVFQMLPLLVYNILFTSISQRQTEMAPSRSSLIGRRLMQTPHTPSLPATFLGQ
jgi:hypothetical protein